jgi:hypothetical protein
MTIKSKYGITPNTPKQLTLNFQIAAEREVDGVGMGVLSNGAPFLTLRGLARMCGVPNSVIVRMTAQWQDSPLRPREKRIREIILEQGGDDSVAFIAVQKDGVINHAVPDTVCMAALEYYAFEAKSESNEHALKSYRILARKGFRDFIYAQVGYNPSGSVSIAWQQFHDRVSLTYHTVPDGYFSIFKELADVIVALIREGADIGPQFMPDISVGTCWAKYWKSESLEVLYGERVQYIHNYPSYFPQAASNPQHPYAYPDEALGEFRQWVRHIYMKENMPNYLNKKVRDGQIPAPAAAKALTALQPRKVLPHKP